MTGTPIRLGETHDKAIPSGLQPPCIHAMSLADAQAVLDVVFGDEVSDSETIYHGTKFEHDPLLLTKSDNRLSRAGSLYFSASTLSSGDGEVVRQKPYVSRMFCVVCDDVGEKYPVPALPPTLIIETSPGNHQYIYVLNDPLPRAEAEMFCTRMKRAIKAGSLDADKGALLTIQLIKLPIGTNDKAGPKKGFATRLLPHDGPMYDSDELAVAWNFPASEELTESLITVGDGVMLDVEDIQDPLLDWLVESGRVMDHGKEDGWFKVRCPLHEMHVAAGAPAHTSGDGSAGYSPLGVGQLPNRRVFSCWHDSCKSEWDADGKTWPMSEEFLTWAAEAGGPTVPRIDNAAALVRQWAMVGGREARDMLATGLTQVAVLKLPEFLNMNAQEGDRQGQRVVTMGNLWKAHPGTVRCRGAFYRPDCGRLYQGDDSQTYINTYNPIVWPRVSESDIAGAGLDVYFAHVSRLIPDAGECALYHQWIAHKLQNPAKRAYAMVLVAEAYGTGRSSLGRVLMRLWQSGVRKPGLDKIAGPKHNSQAVFNNWLVDTQLVISEETKQGTGSWSDDHDMYETLKTLVDTGVTEGVEVSNKYGVDEIATAYCVYLFFTNHADALQIPAGDRRFCVLGCTTSVLPDSMATAINAFARSRTSLAALYWHYMDMDLSAFSEHHPPMTDAKQHMIDAGKSSLQQIIEDVLEDLPGDLVTQPQLLQAVAMAITDDPALEKRTPGAVALHFKRMKGIGTRFRYRGNLVRAKIVRNGDRHKAGWNGDNSYLCEILSRNDERKSNVVSM